MAQDPVERLADRLEKPVIDNRSYRVIRLSNKLEALLVHDPDTDKASASMNVGVGNFSDPDDLFGLAHCLEHLLFMGTEKVCRTGHRALTVLLLYRIFRLTHDVKLVSERERVQPISGRPLRPLQCLHRWHPDKLLL
jgi:hypothetical protein